MTVEQALIRRQERAELGEDMYFFKEVAKVGTACTWVEFIERRVDFTPLAQERAVSCVLANDKKQIKSMLRATFASDFLQQKEFIYELAVYARRNHKKDAADYLSRVYRFVCLNPYEKQKQFFTAWEYVQWLISATSKNWKKVSDFDQLEDYAA